MRLFLGVDGGQSGTTAVIGDETGRVIGRGEAGPCNHAGAAEGRAKLELAVVGSVGAACAQAALDAAAVVFEAACFGMSGGPEDKEAILAGILRTARLVVTNDAVIALAGATANGQGIITIAGTGSIAFGRNGAGVSAGGGSDGARNAGGRSARAGGWGYVFGDEGGAFDIVRQALRASLRMEEGWGPSTSLRQVLLDATGSRSANEMLHRFYTTEWPRSRVATLARLVDTAALEADSVASAVLAAAAQELAVLAGAVRSQLWKPGDPVALAYIGGVFESRLLLERFRMLVELDPATRCGPPRRGPAEGALLEAYREAGVSIELL
ncbi:MAG TPA: BadF/BadG/BcrA/BcrD ATPase family protein [Candidatus Acidoferrales bacterium]|jgi:N-acetylglucosamine kinase-like BadF-type ATPase|nr:BadF/BadG/BcrA/BcrD ATPase family protein [Candidatus Acidoferrales bacterium]